MNTGIVGVEFHESDQQKEAWVVCDPSIENYHGSQRPGQGGREHGSCQCTPGFACNPKTVVTVTGKPNVPDRVDGDISEALELLNSTTKSPKEKYGAPLTASQEYGWDTEYAQRSDLFNYGRKSSEITGHMDAFFKQQEQAKHAAGEAKK
eukprot:m.160749 g.160749  ORF g.160749 m.160749 type:complete len:150 (-) comp18038_c0_seq5:134-583(-)